MNKYFYVNAVYAASVVIEADTKRDADAILKRIVSFPDEWSFQEKQEAAA